MKDADTFVSGLDLLLRDIEERSTGQDLSVLGRECIGLLNGEEVVVVLTDQLFPRMPEELFPRSVESQEPEVVSVLDENHIRDVLDDRVEEGFGRPSLLFRP